MARMRTVVCLPCPRDCLAFQPQGPTYRIRPTYRKMQALAQRTPPLLLLRGGQQETAEERRAFPFFVHMLAADYQALRMREMRLSAARKSCSLCQEKERRRGKREEQVVREIETDTPPD